VLESSFVAEVKSDLMGEQTILCGMLQAGAIVCFDKMVAEGIDAGYAGQAVQFGWETITEALKHGGITNMMDRLSNPAKIGLLPGRGAQGHHAPAVQQAHG
jgi:ketol-acid reductoisomerase